MRSWLLILSVAAIGLTLLAHEGPAFAQEQEGGEQGGGVLVSAGAAEGGSSASGESEEEPEEFFTLTTSVGIYSAYMFRSINLYDGLSIQPSIQGTFNLGKYGNVSLIHWMHLPSQGEQYATKFIEMDEGIGYDFTWDAVTFSLVHYWYLYRNGTANTFPGQREVTATISWDTFLQPYVMLANEYRAYKCQYYEIGLSHTFGEEGTDFNLKLFTTSGFTSNATPYWEGNGYVQTTLGASTEVSVGHLTFTPMISYSNGNDGYTTDQWWGGVNVSLSL